MPYSFAKRRCLVCGPGLPYTLSPVVFPDYHCWSLQPWIVSRRSGTTEPSPDPHKSQEKCPKYTFSIHVRRKAGFYLGNLFPVMVSTLLLHKPFLLLTRICQHHHHHRAPTTPPLVNITTTTAAAAATTTTAFVWHAGGWGFDPRSCQTKDVKIWDFAALLSAQHIRVRDRLVGSESG